MQIAISIVGLAILYFVGEVLARFIKFLPTVLIASGLLIIGWGAVAFCRSVVRYAPDLEGSSGNELLGPPRIDNQREIGLQTPPTMHKRSDCLQPVPERGLVVDKLYLRQILTGSKVMELRSRHTRQLGPIALIAKGSRRVVAVAEIHESVGPLSLEDLRAMFREHQFDAEQAIQRKWIYGWRLRDVVLLPNTVLYEHKAGAMSIVKLDAAAVEGIRRELRGVAQATLAGD